MPITALFVMTTHQAILYGETFLGERDIDQPRWNAERLLMIALKIERASLYVELRRDVSSGEIRWFKRLLDMRGKHYPLAYLEKNQEFFGRDFYVNQTVLIPRPETETLVRAVLNLPLREDCRFLDVGSGSGNVAVTLALERPRSFVVALELSWSAMGVLVRNSAGKVVIVNGDFNSMPFLAESFDVVVANPPYVEQELYESIPEETRWEPYTALVAEKIEVIYTVLVGQSSKVLKPGGFLAFEIGYGQKEKIEAVCLANKGVILLDILKDQRGIFRTVVAQKKK